MQREIMVFKSKFSFLFTSENFLISTNIFIFPFLFDAKVNYSNYTMLWSTEKWKKTNDQKSMSSKSSRITVLLNKNRLDKPMSGNTNNDYNRKPDINACNICYLSFYFMICISVVVQYVSSAPIPILLMKKIFQSKSIFNPTNTSLILVVVSTKTQTENFITLRVRIRQMVAIISVRYKNKK